QMLERYATDVMPQKRPSTIPTQLQHLHWWKNHIGSLSLSEVRPSTILQYRDTLKKTKSNATVNRYMALLSHAFTMAIQWEWSEHNPVRLISKMKEPRGRTRYLSDEEQKRLLEECQKSRNRLLYTIVVVGLSTGARRGELLNLHWDDVDLRRGTLTFRDT